MLVALLLAILTVLHVQGGQVGHAALAALTRMLGDAVGTSSTLAAADPTTASTTLFTATQSESRVFSPTIGVPTLLSPQTGAALPFVGLAAGVAGLVSTIAAATPHRPATTSAPSWLSSIGDWLKQQWVDAKEMFADPGTWVGLAVGVVLGIVAIAAGIASAPVWAVVLVVAAIGVIAAAAGTIVSNLAAGQPWHTNLVRNTLVGAVLSVAGVFLAVTFGWTGILAAVGIAAGSSILSNVFSGQRWDKALLATLALTAVLAWGSGKVLPRLRSGGRQPATAARVTPQNATTLTNLASDVATPDVLAQYNLDSGFSGVYNSATGDWVALASRDASLMNGQAIQTVPQFGGHASAEAALLARTRMTNTSRNIGFTLIKEGPSTLRIRWNSGQINSRNFGDRAAPIASRAALREAISRETGYEVIE